MSKPLETLSLILLPLVIIAVIVYNADFMYRYYAVEHGMVQDAKVCKARILPTRYYVSTLQGKTVTINIELRNDGNFIWAKSGDHPVHLSYHILKANKKMLRYDNQRFELPRDVRP